MGRPSWMCSSTKIHSANPRVREHFPQAMQAAGRLSSGRASKRIRTLELRANRASLRHGGLPTLARFLDYCGDKMEFLLQIGHAAEDHLHVGQALEEPQGPGGGAVLGAEAAQSVHLAAGEGGRGPPRGRAPPAMIAACNEARFALNPQSLNFKD